jgi:hypothetical protein
VKIKTHKYLKELAKAEKRGYEKGLRETEERMLQSERLERIAEEKDGFRARIMKTLEEHERKFAVLCGEAGAEKPVSVEEYDGKCECGPVINCTVAE